MSSEMPVYSSEFSTNAGLRHEAVVNARRASVQSVKDNLNNCIGLKVEVPNVPLESVIGLGEIKKEMLQVLKNGRGRETILLFGAFFCGKSRLVRGLATQLNANLIYVWDAEVLIRWTGKLLVFTEALFQVSSEKAPNTFLYLENVNNMEPQLLIKLMENAQRIWSELAKQSGSSSTLTIIGSTFEPKQMNKEVVMYFNKRIYVPTPNFLERKQLIIKYLKECSKPMEQLQIKDKDVDWLAKKLYGCVPLEIETKIGEILEDTESKEDEKRSAKVLEGILCKRNLTKSDFKKAFKSRASEPLELKTFGEFEAFQKNYGNGPFMTAQERENYVFKDAVDWKGK